MSFSCECCMLSGKMSAMVDHCSRGVQLSGVSECDLETSTVRWSRPTGAVEP